MAQLIMNIGCFQEGCYRYAAPSTSPLLKWRAEELNEVYVFPDRNKWAQFKRFLSEINSHTKP